MLIVWVATKIHEQPKLEPYGADILVREAPPPGRAFVLR